MGIYLSNGSTRGTKLSLYLNFGLDLMKLYKILDQHFESFYLLFILLYSVITLLSHYLSFLFLPFLPHLLPFLLISLTLKMMSAFRNIKVELMRRNCVTSCRNELLISVVKPRKARLAVLGRLHLSLQPKQMK